MTDSIVPALQLIRQGYAPLIALSLKRAVKDVARHINYTESEAIAFSLDVLLCPGGACKPAQTSLIAALETLGERVSRSYRSGTISKLPSIHKMQPAERYWFVAELLILCELDSVADLWAERLYMSPVAL